MGFSLSQGPWTYNRFDLYEKKAKPDFLDMDKDGDKKESMKKAIKEKGQKNVQEKKELPDFIKDKMDKKEGKKSDCGCDKTPCDCDKKKDVKEAYGGKTKSYVPGAKVGVKVKKGPGLKEQVVEFLMAENFANNEVSAEVLYTHMSDEWHDEIAKAIEEGYKPLPKAKMASQAAKAFGKEQAAVAKGDAAGANKQMQRRNAMQMPAARKTSLGK